MNEEKPQQPWSPGIRAGFGTWLGFALVALTNAVFIAILLPRPATGIGIRLQHYVFDACGILGVGLAAAILIGVAVMLVERGTLSARWRWIGRVAGFVAYALLTAVIMLNLVGYELDRTALSRFGGRFHDPLVALGTVLLSISIPTALLVGWWSTRRRSLGFAALLVGLAAMVTNHLVLRDDYAGFHGALAWLAATFVAMPLASWVEMAASKMRERTRRTILVVALVAGLFGLLVPPSVTVRAELFREPAAISAWIMATAIWQLPGAPHAALPPEAAASPYFRARDEVAPVPPTRPPLLEGRAPLVVLVTIDATRADIFDKAKDEAFFPTLAKLRREGAYFTRATSAGSQTAIALSALFSGRYFSQLEWHDHGEGPVRFLYPATDTSPRFPEILSGRGVKTVSYRSITFLSNEYGVTRGFTEETVVVKGRDHAKAEQIINPLLERLEKAGDEPMFVYAHLTEPHSPYDRGGKQGPATQRYLREVRVADEYIGQLLKLLKERFAGRAYLFVSSDHGEAFGEHGMTKHTKTLYEELLRVPLIVYGPGITARRIEEHVTIVDLGPTILDIFGVDTPASFMGQSLVPLLAGRDVHLERPILAEGRLRRVLYWGDLKVIDDPRRKVVEVFDLQHDPRELRNRFDTDRARALPALAALRRFFEVHTLRKDGYEAPYKP